MLTDVVSLDDVVDLPPRLEAAQAEEHKIYWLKTRGQNRIKTNHGKSG
jgi:hypothetical protein